MIENPIKRLIPRLITNPLRPLPLGGLLIVTSDNKILVTTDDKIGIVRK